MRYRLLYLRGICRAERSKSYHVKKTALFELKASLLFLVVTLVERRKSVATDPEAATSGFSVSLFSEKKRERVVNKVKRKVN